MNDDYEDIQQQWEDNIYADREETYRREAEEESAEIEAQLQQEADERAAVNSVLN